MLTLNMKKSVLLYRSLEQERTAHQTFEWEILGAPGCPMGSIMAFLFLKLLNGSLMCNCKK